MIRRACAALVCVLACAVCATASAAPPQDAARGIVRASATGAREAAGQAAAALDRGFDAHVRDQAALELQIGLRLYAMRDDYRAVGAMRRWRLLDDSPRAAFLSGLVVGHVYQRNDQPERAALSYEQAVLAAPDPASRAWSFLLSTQQICVPMAIWGVCGQRLAELSSLESLTPELSELIAYQRLFTGVVARSDWSPELAAGIHSPELERAARELEARDAAFADLPLKSPGLAAGMSALLPGAGQLYNGRWTDALIAFSFNAAFAGATYYSFAHLESVPLGVLSATFLTGFYVGNIANAYVDAEAHNARVYEKYFTGLERDLWARVRFSVDRDSVVFGYTFGWPGDAPRPETAAPTPEGEGDELF